MTQLFSFTSKFIQFWLQQIINGRRIYQVLQKKKVWSEHLEWILDQIINTLWSISRTLIVIVLVQKIHFEDPRLQASKWFHFISGRHSVFWIHENSYSIPGKNILKKLWNQWCKKTRLSCEIIKFLWSKQLSWF